MLSLPTVRQPKRLLGKGSGARPASIVSLLLLVVLAASLILTACSSSKSEPDTFTVTDLLGRSVQVPTKPTCIVTTHPTATETLYRAGGVAAGRDTASKYPTEVLDLPTVGGSYSISTEAVAALAPDLVVIEGLTQGQLPFVGTLEGLGIPVLAIRAMTLEEIYQSLTLVGEILDTTDTASQAVADIEGRIEAAQSGSSEGRSILVLVALSPDNLYAARGNSYPGTVAALLELGNVASGMPDAGGRYAGYALFGAELTTSYNPDVILTITPSPSGPRLAALLPTMPGFKEMPAVKARHVVELDPVLFLQASGPRIAEAVEALLEIMNSLA